MCAETNDSQDGTVSGDTNSKEESTAIAPPSSASIDPSPSSTALPTTKRRRRNQRDKQPLTSSSTLTTRPKSHVRRKSKSLQKHGGEKSSGGITAILPSLAGVTVLAAIVLGRQGFRGRATVAGIDLGTTNSVVCVQAPAKGVGQIDCMVDPSSGSPLVPSVVSFLDASEQTHHAKQSSSSPQKPSHWPVPPSAVVVGQAAKRRIDSHPHHTLYQAKRVLGRSGDHAAVAELQAEVEFGVSTQDGSPVFLVPDSPTPITPVHVGAYVVQHLLQMVQQTLGHANVKSAVICVPAQFNAQQIQATAAAFSHAGLQVARVVEEPTAAALAYGLDRKEGVDYILVYDFGGGTLDVSLLYVSSDGFVDVMGSDGDDRLGGADFDAAVAHFLLQHRGNVVKSVATVLQQLQETLGPSVDLEQALSTACPALASTPLCTESSFHTLGEQLKIGLSAYTPNQDHVSVEAQCLGLPKEAQLSSDVSLDEFCSRLVPITLQLSAQEYHSLVQTLYKRSLLPVERLLQSLDLEPSDIHEVVMVGGTTRMPYVRELVRKALPTAEMNTHIDPDITVAYGAASVID